MCCRLLASSTQLADLIQTSSSQEGNPLTFMARHLRGATVCGTATPRGRTVSLITGLSTRRGHISGPPVSNALRRPLSAWLAKLVLFAESTSGLRSDQQNPALVPPGPALNAHAHPQT